MSNDKRALSCSDCGVVNCHNKESSFPEFCLTTGVSQKEIEKINDFYRDDDGFEGKYAKAAAFVEGTYYGRLTRIEEIIAFAKKIGAKRLGIATCVGLINEAKIFAKILRAKGLDSYSIACKVGSTDKTAIGIPEEQKIRKGCHEALCNPMLQAKLLNKEKTDLNVIIGLCVGHDSIFIKHSKAPVTYLVVKDRVLGHNPVAGLYTTGSYYKKLLQEE